MPDPRVIVVGTTTDYIDLIEERFPGRVVFLTDESERSSHPVTVTPTLREVTADLDDFRSAGGALTGYLKRAGIVPSGITSFDCESLALTAELAVLFGLPFVSRRAVEWARNKYLSKRAWIEAGVRCPKAEIVADTSSALQFVARLNEPVVIKPLSGSGSELTFKCNNKYETLSAFRTIQSLLPGHPNSRMYGPGNSDGLAIDTRHTFEIEEYIEGREYSADFIIDGGDVRVIRVARKIPAKELSFGITLAYIVPARLPKEVSEEQLRQILLRGAQALTIEHSICMVDFMVNRGEIILLEMTPRPGGDCLPPLIRQSLGLDMIELTLDFARGAAGVSERSVGDGGALVGVRLIAQRSGTIEALDTKRIEADPRVREVYLKRDVGHTVILPPEDYDSRILGHVIFLPSSLHDIERECRELASMLDIQMEDGHDAKLHGGTNAPSRIAASANPGT